MHSRFVERMKSQVFATVYNAIYGRNSTSQRTTENEKNSSPSTDVANASIQAYQSLSRYGFGTVDHGDLYQGARRPEACRQVALSRVMPALLEILPHERRRPRARGGRHLHVCGCDV